jgi:hypothetical protein
MEGCGVMDSQLDNFIERAGARAVLMASPAALTDIRHNTNPTDWKRVGDGEMYRGALIEEHDEWSWGWMVRKADGTYVEAEAA